MPTPSMTMMGVHSGLRSPADNAGTEAFFLWPSPRRCPCAGVAFAFDDLSLWGVSSSKNQSGAADGASYDVGVVVEEVQGVKPRPRGTRSSCSSDHSSWPLADELRTGQVMEERESGCTSPTRHAPGDVPE